MHNIRYPDGSIPLPHHGLVSEFDDRLVILPAASDFRSVGFSVWEPEDAGYRYFIRESCLRNSPQYIDAPDFGGDYIFQEVRLLPRPDNAYNSDAISIAFDDTSTIGTSQLHLGYMYDSEVRRYGNLIEALIEVANKPVHCIVALETLEYSPDWSDEFGEDIAFYESLGYLPVGRILLLPRRNSIISMVGDFVRSSMDRNDIIVANEPLHLTSSKTLRETLLEIHGDSRFKVDVTASENLLSIHSNGIHIKDLDPRNERFFDRTFDLICSLGGKARATAEIGSKSVRIFVEDYTPYD